MNYCDVCKRDLPEGEECPVCGNRPTKEQVIELAKEWCYFQPNGPKCYLNCEKCRKYGAWMGYKVPVVRLIKKWERMKNERD